MFGNKKRLQELEKRVAELERRIPGRLVFDKQQDIPSISPEEFGAYLDKTQQSKSGGRKIEPEHQPTKLPDIADLQECLNTLLESDRAIQKVDLFIYYGASGIGRGNACIHIALPCGDKPSEEY